MLFNVWFAFVFLFRESFNSPHPQGSWSHDWMVLWFCLAMVYRFGGHRSLPAPIAIDLSKMSFEYLPRHAFDSLLILVWHVIWFGLQTLLKKLFHFFPLRLSFHATGELPPFPFSGSHYVLRNNQCNIAGSTEITNCSWSANSVGFMYATFPMSANPVGAAKFSTI